ncbi:helix-turn-helix domain-containing protein [Halobacillus salinus]|uniref:SEC-C domain-containing protein n=1 Tax=Halobacillus salinus TaxID=192814 RepID=A0A4Z0GY74_9BACI|nr:LysR family transcriptional regulator [Halobacillus salinus]TGB02397.1 hypothetical protein E4663_13735 [Halobacillus salinus]
MQKVGRNDPCPCGSGKKYKKCCINENVVEFPGKAVKDELDQAFQRYQDYLVNVYPDYLPKEAPNTQEERIGQFFQLLQDSVFTARKGGTSIMEEFANEEMKTAKRPLTKESLQAWTKPAAGVFALDSKEKGVQIKSMFNDATYMVEKESIPLEDIETAPYYFGVLMKWGNVHQFMPIAIPKDEKQFELYWTLLTENQKSHDYFEKNLADQFKVWLKGKEEAQAKTEESTEEDSVLALLDESTSREVKDTWKSYRDAETPNIRKPEVFAAALDFIAAEGVTKKATAEKFGVSPSSMSRRIKELENYR